MEDLAILVEYFPNLSEDQVEKFKNFAAAFREWNEKINLVSRKDIEFLVERHILHSLAIANVIRFSPGTAVMDVGTGGGFPGIPLAILFPEVQFTLVDSIGKKIMVVNDIVQRLGLENVTCRHARVEEIKGQFDFITGRAVTDLNAFYGLVHKKIKVKDQNGLPNGILYLKGGELEADVQAFGNRVQVFPISGFFKEDYFTTKAVMYIQR